MKLEANKIEEYLLFADQLADAARLAILPYFRRENGVANKGSGIVDFDPVTKADKAAEFAMRELINTHFPNDAIIGEEYGDTSGTSGVEWILDPIDGTRAFMAGTSSWGVLIGGYYKGAPIFGVMDQPFTKERWSGNLSAKLAQFMHHEKRENINANQNARINNSVISTTDPFLFNEKEYAAFAQIRANAPVVRYGLDCMAYGLLAHGTIGLVVETGLKLVDIGALIPIVEASGGIITDWRGNQNPNGGQVVAAANQYIHAEALEYLANAAV